MARSETERALATTIAKLVAENKDLLAACKRKDEIIAGIIETAKKEGLINLNWIIAAQKELDREAI